MKETTFGNVIVGQKFYINEKEYVKLKTQKITCCKSINCQLSNASSKAFFKDSTIVKVN